MEYWTLHTHTHKKKKKKEERRKVEQSTTIEFKRRKRDWNGEPKLASDGLLMTWSNRSFAKFIVKLPLYIIETIQSYYVFKNIKNC